MAKIVLKESSVGKTISTEKGHFKLSANMRVSQKEYIYSLKPDLFDAEEKKVEEKSK